MNIRKWHENDKQIPKECYMQFHDSFLQNQFITPIVGNKVIFPSLFRNSGKKGVTKLDGSDTLGQ